MSDTAILNREDLSLPTKPDTFDWVRKLFRPLTRPANSDAPTEVDAADNPFVLKRNKTVLVVDDDPVFVKATCARLKADGYEVLSAPDSSKAMELLRCHMPDVVVLDVNLPDDFTGLGWDGLKLVSWMNRLDAFKKIPVVMITSGDPSKYTRLSLKAGAAAFFHKQLEPAQLLALVENSLERKTPNPSVNPSPAPSKSNFPIQQVRSAERCSALRWESTFAEVSHQRWPPALVPQRLTLSPNACAIAALVNRHWSALFASLA
ncbi:MAG TPA: response regulator [Verrucomicrobiae bacterium]|nr:response regulator [Verrucomicrobiae bacterium]